MSGLISFLQTHMLSCPSKKWLHMECPGCGMQRSFILLLQGRFQDSFFMYPPLVPIMLLLFFLVLHVLFRLKKGASILLWMFLFNAVIIVISFGIRLYASWPGN